MRARRSPFARELLLQVARVAARERHGNVALLPQVRRESEADLPPQADADDEPPLGELVLAPLQRERIDALRARHRAARERCFIADIDETDGLRRERRELCRRDLRLPFPFLQKISHVLLPFRNAFRRGHRPPGASPPQGAAPRGGRDASPQRTSVAIAWSSQRRSTWTWFCSVFFVA